MSLLFFATETFTFERGDKSAITVHVDQPKEGDCPLIVYLAPGKKQSALSLHQALYEKTPLFALLTIEHRGVTPNQIGSEEFDRTHTVEARVEDHLLVLQKLREGLIPGWNGKLALLGEEEGAYVATDLSAKVPELSAIALIRPGGGMNPLEERIEALRSTLIEEGSNKRLIRAEMAKAYDTFQQAIDNPSPFLYAYGATYKWWASMLGRKGEPLAKVDCPIYLSQQISDLEIPVESTDRRANLLKQMGKTLTYERLEEPKPLYEGAVTWLKEELEASP
jgi:hypothetical protein